MSRFAPRGGFAICQLDYGLDSILVMLASRPLLCGVNARSPVVAHITIVNPYQTWHVLVSGVLELRCLVIITFNLDDLHVYQ